jgi:hypothetical protein
LTNDNYSAIMQEKGGNEYAKETLCFPHGTLSNPY